jgi:Na+-driven multidrug efflux pump
MFQALGNTIPALISTATRLMAFIVPAIWLSKQSDFAIEHLWYVSVTTVCIQAIVSLLLLKIELNKHVPKTMISASFASKVS